ncbi:YcxB family protein [Novosphingobium sp. P6W]|uniref:YcxB family protein n=1 Tax=Novosphingobium sp. P6W TaxID=1609758 RepID=UPI0005C2C06C|nr:YcxB family protein [Novosphingobium sp. P6W]AXB76519.1 YcxB family protein [Novosphingobium sp. P6W]KIS30766.1 hypothetical protein TQ38_20355 [Novosphingobium sp. P6W]
MAGPGGTFTVALSYEDYLACNWLMIRRRWLWKGLARFIGILGAAYAVLFCVIDLIDGKSVDFTSVALAFAIGFGSAVVAAALGALALLWRIPRSARKTYRQLKFEGVDSLFTFSREGIESSNRFGKSTNLWSDFSGWAENERVLLLFRTSQIFYPVPKAQIAPETLQTLRRAITAGAVPTKW